jgi:glycosyltransferase involved in cell wall biosynthesis
MKIAFIGQKGIPAKNGGVERYVESLATNLANLGQEVLAYNRNDYLTEPLAEYHGVRIINRPYINTKNLANITQTLAAIFHVAREKADVIHFQGIGPSLLCWLPKILNPRVKIVATLHSFDYYNDKWSGFAKMMLRFGEKLMCRYADEVIVLTQLMADYVKGTYHREATIVPNGADLYNGTADNELRIWDLKKDSYILGVSRIIKLKGYQYLIPAFKDLKTDKKLVITGDGEYLPELRQLAGNDPRIIFTGNQKGAILDQLYANAYLFVQSSEMEGLSISLLEAMAHKNACLVSDISANLNVVQDTGFVFSSKDTASLRDKLQFLIDNPQEVENTAQKAYERIQNNFLWSDVARKVLEVYKK